MPATRKALGLEDKIVREGLYRVTTSHFVAGFVVKDGKVVLCAPILKRGILYWLTVAQWICE